MSNSGDPYPIHLATILFPFFSGLVLLLVLPPFIWHVRSGNVGASSLIFWLLLGLGMNTINGIVWPRDNTSDWFPGYGLCDVEVRLRVAVPVGVSCALGVILFRLARVLDTARATVTTGQEECRRRMVWDSGWCFGPALVQMVVYYVVQSTRFNIFAITGCSFPIEASWPSVSLVLIWPPVISAVGCFYAMLLVWRLYRYRQDFSRLISAASSTRSRFLRLFLLSLFTLLMVMPTQIFWVVWLNLSPDYPRHPYSWKLTHTWDAEVRFPSNGEILEKTHIMWIPCGVLVFAFFGFGREARNMYVDWAKACRVSKVCPGLLRKKQPGEVGTSSFMTSIASKTRSWFSKGSGDEFRRESFLNTITTTTTNASAKASHTSSYRFSVMPFGKTRGFLKASSELPVAENRKESPPTPQPVFTEYFEPMDLDDPDKHHEDIQRGLQKPIYDV